MIEREKAIAARRALQPEAELERKWLKARGRWSNRYWSQEWLDLARHRARKLAAFLRVE